ncbi:DUF3551 domain-containing protein [Bradyrhizobium sp.]|uniref:DUF3551 domain-containing protein n=1 Tax=Bradyrhizobium sp. TaxID=376 RepID=UPI00239852BE|nr:DUF3551 domain-containing protein [Bradyrhizobium sp.]MDE2379554.1 DUF3551 domain-containing protein [Bradyrhizobium sp.]
MIRFATFAIAAVAALWLGRPARAQTYDPAYPVCMQIFGPVGYFDCRYATIEQCKFLAVGRAAQCMVNPYFAPKKPTSGRRSTRSN